MELNILTPAQRDMLHVTGMAMVAGTLNVSLAVNAPQPQLGDSFELFDFGSTSGSFAGVSLPDLATGLSWDVGGLMSTGALAVIVAPPGDFDHDSDVDGNDFLAWQRGESLNPNSTADLDHYGSRPWATASASAIPEPGATSLASLAALALASCRRRMGV